MQKWWRRIRAVVALAVVWALGGIAVGGFIELLDNVAPAAHAFTRRIDMWPQTLAILGFLCGVLFAVLLGVVGRRRRFEEFSLGQFATWGAVAGAVLGAVGMALGAGVLLPGVTTLLSAIGGAGSLLLARKAERWGLVGAGTADAALPGADAPRPRPNALRR